jgi:hypothetical protein
MPIEDNLDNIHDDDNEVIINDNDKDLSSTDNDNNEPDDDAGYTDNNNNTSDDEPALTGIEKFLSDYGVVGGMITFEEGDKKHFDDLSDDEKYNVISTLIETNSQPIEQKYGLEPEEIQLLNYFRTQDKPISESLNEIVERRFNELAISQAATTTNFENMAPEAIYLRWLKENNPEAEDEDLRTDLEAAKNLKSFEKTVTGLKKVFIEKQESDRIAQENLMRQEQFQELENDRELIVKQVSQIDQIAGFEVNDDEKNEILTNLLEVNEHGDSLFMEEVFSDPAKLFKAAWLYNKAESMFDNMADYYKKELSKQYKKGRDEALSGAPGRPITVSTNSNKRDNIAKRDEVNAKTQDELFDDED